ncbi:MAG: AI-2E family transporter [Clostridia bacterium]|nr:AI-2E family transporter [Clostridia bacterium]
MSKKKIKENISDGAEKVADVVKDVGNDFGRGLWGFIKAKWWMFIITVCILALGIAIAGTPLMWVLPISVVIAIIDLLPVLGCGVVLLPWAAIAYFLGHNKYMCIVLAITYLVLLIGRQIIEPKLMGDQIGVRPFITFLFTVMGSLMLGPVGIIVGPLAAVILTSLIRAIKGTKDPRK